MKRNSILIIILVLLFGFMYWSNLNDPVKFVWSPTYDINDKQPYGCYALDEILFASWEQGYTHSYDNIYDLYTQQEHGISDNAVLILCNNFTVPDYDLDLFFDYIEKGGTIFIAADNFFYGITDSLGIGYNYDFSSYASLPLNQEKKSIHFSNSSSIDSIPVPRSMMIRSFTTGEWDKVANLDVHSLAVNNEEESILLNYRLGKGNLYLCYTPLLFTNYAVLDDSLNRFVWQALAPLKDKPLLRTEYYGKGRALIDRDSDSRFRYLLSQPPLRWAFYLVLVLVLLFMIFTAKRKQKPIPVVKPPSNKMLAFVRSITTLYLRRNNNADIIMKKYFYWSDGIRRKYGIDVVNEHHNKDFIKRFSAKTGMPESDARHLFLELDGIREYTDVSDKEMMDLIMKMRID